jgi:phosphoesterase RecJ-like protein
MDGDAVGSSKALCLALRRLGKRCDVITEDAFPHTYDFLDSGDIFIDLSEYEGGRDLAIAVDLGELERLEKRREAFMTSPVNIIIDHHISDLPEAPLFVSDSEACAAAFLVQEILEKYYPQVLDREIAEALYVGIMTDTGTLRFTNADARAVAAVHRLYAYGIRHAEICTHIYEEYPQTQLKLEALTVERARLFHGGAGVISWISLADLAANGADSVMTDTCIDRIRVIKDVEIACLIKEKEDGRLKVSLRSKLGAGVADIAASFGGGGHFKAAGCTLTCGMEEAVETMIKAIDEKLERWIAAGSPWASK